MESALYGVYTLVVLYQKSHSFASLTCSISDTPQLVCKHRTRALSMKYSIFIHYSSRTYCTIVHVHAMRKLQLNQPYLSWKILKNSYQAHSSLIRALVVPDVLALFIVK